MKAAQDSRAILDAIRDGVDRGLTDLVEPTDQGFLYDALRFALSGKGKRIRSTLTILAGRMYSAPEDALLDAALAVEVFHTFSLIHDDIMDGSSVRRGKDTVHIRFGEPTAILVGDLMLGMTYELLSRSFSQRIKQILKLQGDTVRTLCEGQVQDMQFEKESIVSVDEYLEMIDRKTGRLLSSSLEYGGLFGEATQDDLLRLFTLGQHLGRAFQIQDDLLDLTARDLSWGKQLGGDLISGKKTFLLCSALERAEGEEYEWLTGVVAVGKLATDQISTAIDRLEDLGVLETAREAVIFHSSAANVIVSEFPDSESQIALAFLVESLKKRRF